MPDYLVTDPDSGRKLKLTGDSPPTEAELEEIFSSIPIPRNFPTEQSEPENDNAMIGSRGALLTIGSSMIAEPIAGLSGLASAPFVGLDRASDIVDSTRDAITIDPPNKSSERLLEGIGSVAGTVGKAISSIPAAFASFSQEDDLLAAQDFNRESRIAGEERFNRIQERGIGRSVGEGVADLTGSPGAGAIASTVPTAIASAVGLKNPLSKAKTEFVKTSRGLDSVEERAAVGVPDNAVSVGRPTLDDPVDFTPPISAEKIVAGLRKGKTEEVAKAVIPDVKTVESAQRLGVDLNPEHYSTNSAFQDVARALKTRPGSSLQANEVAVLDSLSRRADDLVERNSGFLDKAEFSQEIGADIGAAIDDLQKQADIAYKSVRSSIPAQTKVNTQLIREFIDRKLADFGGDKTQLSKVEKQLLALVKRTKDGNKIPPTYATLDNIRRNVGEGFNRSGPFKNGSDGNLREVYSVLSDVQDGVARSFGAGNIYSSARDLIVKRKALEDNAVQLFGRNISGSLVPKLRGAATGLVSGDISKFNQLINSLPSARRSEAAATILGDIFSGGSRRGGELGTGFVASFNSLNRNQTAKNAIFSHLQPEARKRFDDIGRVLTGIVKSNRKPLGNPSGSGGPIVKALDDLSGIEKIYDVGKKVAAAEGISTSVGLPGAGSAGVIGSILAKQKTPVLVAADEMLSSPSFTRAINKAVEGDVSTANQIIENSPSFKKWVTKIDQVDAANIAKIGFISWFTGEQ